jgi:hypothetical protein
MRPILSGKDLKNRSLIFLSLAFGFKSIANIGYGIITLGIK